MKISRYPRGMREIGKVELDQLWATLGPHYDGAKDFADTELCISLGGSVTKGGKGGGRKRKSR